jgi:hypothetical protein
MEENELWVRDPVECIRELVGNPAFRDYLAYDCQQVFTDKEGERRRYDEMWTGEWWWKTQVSYSITQTVKNPLLRTALIAAQVTERCCSCPRNSRV